MKVSIDQFVYNEILNGAILQNALPQMARRNAEIGRKMYLKSAFGSKSVGRMIMQLISESVKETKAFNRSIKTAKGKLR